MVNFSLCKKENKIKYIINGFMLYEYNLFSKTTRIYDLTNEQEKQVFQTHLKHFARYYMEIDINSFDLYYLYSMKWL